MRQRTCRSRRSVICCCSSSKGWSLSKGRGLDSTLGISLVNFIAGVVDLSTKTTLDLQICHVLSAAHKVQAIQPCLSGACTALAACRMPIIQGGYAHTYEVPGCPQTAATCLTVCRHLLHSVKALTACC